MWFRLVYMWGWAKMAGRRNKNAIKFVLQVLIKSEKKTSSGYLECGGLEVVWGVFLSISTASPPLGDYVQVRVSAVLVLVFGCIHGPGVDS